MNNYFRRKLRGIRASHNGVPKDTAEATNTDTISFSSTSNKNLVDLQIYGNTEMQTNGVLPTGYTQLEYIESSGTQYINTGVVPFDNIGFKITYYSLSDMSAAGTTTYGCMLGSRVSSNNAELQFTTWSGVVADKGCIAYGSTARQAAGITNLTKQTVTLQNLQYSAPDSTYDYTFSSYTWSTSGNTYPIFLFGLNNAGTFAQSGRGCRIYDFIIYNGSTIAYHFIPAKRNSDSVLGMYDIINNTFKINAGTGTFTTGAECPYPEVPSVISSVGNKTGNLLGVNRSSFQTTGTWNQSAAVSWDYAKGYVGYNISGFYQSSSAIYNWSYSLGTVSVLASGTNHTGIAFPITINSNSQYTLACTCNNPNDKTAQVAMTFYDNSGHYISFANKTAATANSSGTVTWTPTIPANATSAAITFLNGGGTAPTVSTQMTVFSNIQLVEGSYTAQTMPAYEPYGYKIPISLSGNNLMKVAGRTEQTISGSGQSVKRILGDDKWAKLMANNNPSYPSNVVVGDDYVSFTALTTNYGVALPVKLKPNTAYTVTANVDINNETSQMIIRVAFYSSDGTWLSQTAGTNGANSGSILANFTTPANAEMTSISFVKYLSESGITTPTLKASNIMLVEGTYTSSTMPQYEPYHTPTAYTVYLDEPLRKVGDNVDYLSLKDWKVYRNTAEYNYKGTESIILFDNNKGFRYTIGNQKEGKALDGFCNRYKNYKLVGDSTSSQRVIFGASDSDTQMYIRKFNTDTSDTTVADMQTALSGWYNAGNPLTVIYPTQNQTEQSITVPTIATVNGTNVIKIGTAITPTKIKVEFYV